MSEMDLLPDELLLTIFGLVEDGATLLDSVSVVCKRWHGLAADVRAWASVRVDVRPSHRPGRLCNTADHTALFDAARVILRAPALRELKLRLPFRNCAHVHLVPSALRRSNLKVHELSLLCDRYCWEHTEWFTEVLRRLAPHLEVLKTNLAREQYFVNFNELTALRRLDYCPRGQWCNASDLPHTLEELTMRGVVSQHLESVQHMPRLRRLAVYFSYPHSQIVFPRPPADHCGLRWLRVWSIGRDTLLTLVRAHAATLRELEIVCSSKMDEGLSECKPSFVEFGEAFDELTLTGLPVLRRLVLLRKDRWPHDAESCREQTASVQQKMGEAVAVLCSLCQDC